MLFPGAGTENQYLIHLSELLGPLNEKELHSDHIKHWSIN